MSRKPKTSTSRAWRLVEQHDRSVERLGGPRAFGVLYSATERAISSSEIGVMDTDCGIEAAQVVRRKIARRARELRAQQRSRGDES